ncbi:MAG: 2'-5' RNA ligase family protein [Anaerolineae bacterium]|nr:2'-5' RNA ligase family protein [Anaerolineae bacterium]
MSRADLTVNERLHTYAETWDAFSRLDQTRDSLVVWRGGLRSWVTVCHLGFIIPIEDGAAASQLARWQAAFRPWLRYDPQPVDRLHVSLHHVGMVRRLVGLPLPRRWQGERLTHLAAEMRGALKDFASFDVRIGPLNAFPTALIAEVHDDSLCLGRLRAAVRRALPTLARPAEPWASYLPHVTLSYWGEQPAAPLVEALRPFRDVEPVSVSVNCVKFTWYTLNAVLDKRKLLTTARENVITEVHLHK